MNRQCVSHEFCKQGKLVNCPHRGKHDCDEAKGYCSLVHRVTTCRKVLDELLVDDFWIDDIEEKGESPEDKDFWLDSDDELCFDDEPETDILDDELLDDEDDWDI